jgi:hypothetical protein
MKYVLSTRNSASELTQLWWKRSSNLHHNSILTQTGLFFQKFLAKNKTSAVPQSPYSSDFSPGNFILFPKLKASSALVPELNSHRFLQKMDI